MTIDSVRDNENNRRKRKPKYRNKKTKYKKEQSVDASWVFSN